MDTSDKRALIFGITGQDGCYLAELLLSKILPYYALAIASMLLCVGLAVTLFAVPFRGSQGAPHTRSVSARRTCLCGAPSVSRRPRCWPWSQGNH